MKKLLLIAVVLAGCGTDNSASIPSDYSKSQQPEKPPAMTGAGGDLAPPPPPSLNP